MERFDVLRVAGHSATSPRELSQPAPLAAGPSARVKQSALAGRRRGRLVVVGSGRLCRRRLPESRSRCRRHAKLARWRGRCWCDAACRAAALASTAAHPPQTGVLLAARRRRALDTRAPVSVGRPMRHFLENPFRFWNGPACDLLLRPIGRRSLSDPQRDRTRSLSNHSRESAAGLLASGQGRAHQGGQPPMPRICGVILKGLRSRCPQAKPCGASSRTASRGLDGGTPLTAGQDSPTRFPISVAPRSTVSSSTDGIFRGDVASKRIARFAERDVANPEQKGRAMFAATGSLPLSRPCRAGHLRASAGMRANFARPASGIRQT